jgi:cyanate lyase
MTNSAMTEAVLAAKKAKGLTWAALAQQLGLGEVWLASCGLGENCLDPESAEKLGNVLGLTAEVRAALIEPPLKGWSMEKPIPTDPLIYRFYEIVAVYGTTLKAVIQEKFGNGIMSAIDFKMEVEKEAHPKGDRVVVKLNGKFLPYTKW